MARDADSKTTDVGIRPARIEDAPRIVEMARALTDFENELTGGTRYFGFGLTVDKVERHCFGERPLGHVLIAEVDGAAVGYLIYLLVFDTTSGNVGLWMADLYVEAAHRGGRIGHALMQALLDECPRHDARDVGWQVQRENEATIAFYDHYAGVDPDIIYWTGIDDFAAKIRARSK